MFTLDEVRAVLANKPEFGVYERDFGTVVDYNVAFEGTFVGANERETLILQNLRGTCFNHAGKIIRLAFHKFHNLNENPAYAADKFDFTQPHYIEEKMDGSMIAPVPFADGTYRLGTRAGVTDVAMKAERFLTTLDERTQQGYDEFIKQCIADELTPIFEYCARDQRIVIDYAQPALVLTAIRDNRNGSYFVIENNAGYVPDCIPLIKRVFNSEHSNVSDLAAVIRELKGREGVVVKFYDGRFVKIKGDDYCLKHRALDGLRFEKDVLQLVLKNELDDVLPLVADDIKERLTAYRDSVLHRLEIARQEMVGVFERHCKVPSKKEFAEMVKNSPYKSGLFKMWDGK
jgi:RNA ligase